MATSNQPSTWKENTGFPSIGIGIVIVIGALYGWLEGLPGLTSSKHELLVSVLIGLGLILFGLFLTWPRTRTKISRK
ncbi:hypothetical protein KBD34_03800 [Patescibacteria group bacterium]|nr:hypothetical protein [Patescibacteria group bacterium]